MTDQKLYLFAYQTEGENLECMESEFVRAQSVPNAINKFIKACGKNKFENNSISGLLMQCVKMNFFDKKKAARATNLYNKMMKINDDECFDSDEVYDDPANYIKFINDNFKEICEFIEDNSHGQDNHTIFSIREVKDIIE